MPPKPKPVAEADMADTGEPRLKPEDFVKALLDPRVMEALTKALTPLR